MSIVYLKVKIKSLAAEAKIIREQEKKHIRNNQIRNGLTEHRKTVVRSEQRATLLAYAFLRGKSYQVTEPKSKCENAEVLHRVRKMSIKYSEMVDKGSVDYRLQEWFKT